MGLPTGDYGSGGEVVGALGERWVREEEGRWRAEERGGRWDVEEGEEGCVVEWRQSRRSSEVTG